jgi:hypothetical protein
MQVMKKTRHGLNNLGKPTLKKGCLIAFGVGLLALAFVLIKATNGFAEFIRMMFKVFDVSV